MSRVVIDTNGYSALMGGDRRVADLLAQSDAVLLTPVVLGELYDGFRGGSRKSSRRSVAKANQYLLTTCG